MKLGRRAVALVMVGVMASGLGGGVALLQAHPAKDFLDGYHVGDTFDGQIVYQVGPGKVIYTAPDRPCTREDGSAQEPPCVGRAGQDGLRGDSVIIIPDGEGDREVIRFK